MKLYDPAAKAAVLVEALPYIRRFWQRIVVVKYGGNALAAASPPGQPRAGQPPPGQPRAGQPRAGQPRAGQPSRLALFAGDIALMRSVGMRPVVVHGGGPQIGEVMTRLGKEPEFRDGLRVTDAETLEIARMVLVGKVNREVVSAINLHAPIAVGLSGEDAGLITAKARDPELGYVGDVGAINPDLLHRLIAEDLVPVVATIGNDPAGQAYNINADTAAGSIAVALGAAKLVYLTDVDGVRSDRFDPSSLLSTTTPRHLEALIAQGSVSEGMIPKARSCAHAVRSGVPEAHILDGRTAHALLLEIFTEEGIGTMVVPDEVAAPLQDHP